MPSAPATPYVMLIQLNDPDEQATWHARLMALGVSAVAMPERSQLASPWPSVCFDVDVMTVALCNDLEDAPAASALILLNDRAGDPSDILDRSSTMDSGVWKESGLWKDPLLMASLPRSVGPEVVCEVARLLVGHVKMRAELKHNAALLQAWVQKAHTDSLTGLPNRRAWDAEFIRRAAASRSSRGHTAIVVVDLHDFKLWNDRYGHPAGDALLCHFGRTIRQILPAEDFVARLGGDEFGILFRCQNQLDLVRFMEQLARQWSMLGERPVSHGDHFWPAGEDCGTPRFCAGATIIDPSEKAAAELLFARADRGLLAAKCEDDATVVICFADDSLAAHQLLGHPPPLPEKPHHEGQ